jgi:hypothetical protein
MLSTSPIDGTSPLKVKDVMNLTTKVSSMSLHPSGQLLAIGSDQKKDQLRMVHLPSCSVSGNWPTSRTPLGRVRCVDFSQGLSTFYSLSLWLQMGATSPKGIIEERPTSTELNRAEAGGGGRGTNTKPNNNKEALALPCKEPESTHATLTSRTEKTTLWGSVDS